MARNVTTVPAFNILTVRAFDQDYPESRLYPKLSRVEGEIVATEPGDGSNIMSFQAVYAVVYDTRSRIPRKLAETHGPTIGIVSDCRLAVSCEKFTKGSTWVGAGPGVVIAAGAMAVSAARARSRRQGKIMVGHVRYEWVSRVGTWAGKYLSLEYSSNQVPKKVELHIRGGIAYTVAQDIVRRVAMLRLAQKEDLPGEQRAALEVLQQAEAFSPALKGWQYYELPGSVMVRTAASR